jgi:hypothetical protein
MGKDILDMTLQKAKAKIDEWDYITLKSFCSPKETLNRLQGKPREWEKMCQTIHVIKG